MKGDRGAEGGAHCARLSALGSTPFRAACPTAFRGRLRGGAVLAVRSEQPLAPSHHSPHRVVTKVLLARGPEPPGYDRLLFYGGPYSLFGCNVGPIRVTSRRDAARWAAAAAAAAGGAVSLWSLHFLRCLACCAACAVAAAAAERW
eukprot:gene4171-5243_t